MARLLKCENIGIECDSICADSEEELLIRATPYAKVEERWIEMPGEFRDRALSLSRSIG
jgi:hypothetical protein